MAYGIKMDDSNWYYFCIVDFFAMQIIFKIWQFNNIFRNGEKVEFYKYDQFDERQMPSFIFFWLQ